MTNPTTGKDFYDLSGPDLLAYCGADASKWAQAFCRIKEAQGWSAADIDEGLMIGWFANAIEHSEQTRQAASHGSAGGEAVAWRWREISDVDAPDNWHHVAKEPHFMNPLHFVAEPLYALSPPVTIDSVPSCGQENDYRRASAGPVDAGAREIVKRHLSWLFQYVQGMNAGNWHDMKMRAERQLEQLSLMLKEPAGAAQAPTDYSAWLIEMPERFGPLYFHFEHDDDWTKDHDKACHFSRKEDAEKVIEHYGWTRAVAVEHMWPAPSLSAAMKAAVASARASAAAKRHTSALPSAEVPAQEAKHCDDQSHDHRVYFMCQSCEDHNPEGAVGPRSDIAVMPDGTWLCDGCYSDCDKSAYGLIASDVDDFEFPRFEDLPRPAPYGAPSVPSADREGK